MISTYPYHVYIVKCRDGTLYTGITNDLERRLLQHNGEIGGGARYTKYRGPVELVYVEKFQTRSEAQKREWHIKNRMSREEKLELIRAASKEDVLKSI